MGERGLSFHSEVFGKTTHKEWTYDRILSIRRVKAGLVPAIEIYFSSDASDISESSEALDAGRRSTKRYTLTFFGRSSSRDECAALATAFHKRAHPEVYRQLTPAAATTSTTAAGAGAATGPADSLFPRWPRAIKPVPAEVWTRLGKMSLLVDVELPCSVQEYAATFAGEGDGNPFFDLMRANSDLMSMSVAPWTFIGGESPQQQQLPQAQAQGDSDSGSGSLMSCGGLGSPWMAASAASNTRKSCGGFASRPADQQSGSSSSGRTRTDTLSDGAGGVGSLPADVCGTALRTIWMTTRDRPKDETCGAAP